MSKKERIQNLLSGDRYKDSITVDGMEYDVARLYTPEIARCQSVDLDALDKDVWPDIQGTDFEESYILGARQLYYSIYDPETGERLFDEAHIPEIYKRATGDQDDWFQTLLEKSNEVNGWDDVGGTGGVGSSEYRVALEKGLEQLDKLDDQILEHDAIDGDLEELLRRGMKAIFKTLEAGLEAGDEAEAEAEENPTQAPASSA